MTTGKFQKFAGFAIVVCYLGLLLVVWLIARNSSGFLLWTIFAFMLLGGIERTTVLLSARVPKDEGTRE
ncbi:hypothetical protein OAS39_10605 [Pirellulales bacterium]|nr:hypothetical protein [Pirellulales bacterium]